MGCTKCKQEKLNKEIRYNEIINPYLNQNKNTFKSVSILDELNNKIKNDNYNSYNVYNKKEICSVLGVNEKQLKEFRFKGKLSYTRVGDKYWYTQDDIDEFMAKHHRKAFA